MARLVAPSSFAASLLALSLGFVVGCSEDEGRPDNSGGASSCSALEPARAPGRLLTREQYNNTVRDLLGDSSGPGAAFPPVAAVEGFENNTELHRANPLLVNQYLRAAESVAAAAIERGLERFLPCTWDTPDPARCGHEFIDRFGKSAFRRPLDPAERSALERLFDRTLSAEGFRNSIQWVIEAALQSPQFLYRVDSFGAATSETGAVRIGAWQMASRLSYFLWNSMPDAALFEAAETDELSTEQQIEQQARRMLEDERARSVVLDFHRQWLGLDRFSGIVRDATDQSGRETRLPAAWRASLDAFIDHVYWSQAGNLQAFLSSPTVFVNADLASLYGVSPPADAGLSATDFSAHERAGLLTQPGLLALLSHPNQSSPIRRGVFIRERIMCEPLPPPPPEVDTTPPDPDPNATTRERFKTHTANGACARCHEKIDGVGFGLESYDEHGRFRLVESDMPLDVSGEIVGTRDPGLRGKFNGPIELAHRLAESDQVRDCIATQWYRYAMGRIEGDEDACSVAQAQQAFARSKGSFKELLVALTQTDAFLYRPPAADENRPPGANEP